MVPGRYTERHDTESITTTPLHRIRHTKTEITPNTCNTLLPHCFYSPYFIFSLYCVVCVYIIRQSWWIFCCSKFSKMLHLLCKCKGK